MGFVGVLAAGGGTLAEDGCTLGRVSLGMEPMGGCEPAGVGAPAAGCATVDGKVFGTAAGLPPLLGCVAVGWRPLGCNDADTGCGPCGDEGVAAGCSTVVADGILTGTLAALGTDAAGVSLGTRAGLSTGKVGTVGSLGDPTGVLPSTLGVDGVGACPFGDSAGDVALGMAAGVRAGVALGSATAGFSMGEPMGVVAAFGTLATGTGATLGVLTVGVVPTGAVLGCEAGPAVTGFCDDALGVPTGEVAGTAAAGDVVALLGVSDGSKQ